MTVAELRAQNHELIELLSRLRDAIDDKLVELGAVSDHDNEVEDDDDVSDEDDEE